MALEFLHSPHSVDTAQNAERPLTDTTTIDSTPNSEIDTNDVDSPSNADTAQNAARSLTYTATFDLMPN